MGEPLSVSLTLVDRITSPALKAAESLKKIESQVKKTQDALGNRFAASWGKIGAAAEKMAAKHNASFANSWGKIGAAAEKSAKRQQDAFAGMWAKIGMARTKEEIARKKQEEREKKEHSLISGVKEGVGWKAFTGALVGSMLVEGAMKAGEFLIETAHKFIEIFTDGFKDAVQAGANRQNLRLASRLSLGSKGGKEMSEDVESFADRTSFTGDELTRMLLPLRRAGLDQNAAKQMLATAMDIAVGSGEGGSQEAIGGYLDAFRKIQLKGGVSSKLLTTLGVNQKDFYKELGKSGYSEKEAEHGKVPAQLLMNLVTKSVNKQQGGAAGTGEFSFSKTMMGRLQKMGKLPEEYLAKVVDSPAFEKLSDSFGKVLEKLNPDSESGKKIVGNIQRMFGKIVGWFDYLTSDEGMDAIAGAAQRVFDAFESIVDAVTSLIGYVKDLYDISVKAASPLSSILEFGKKLGGGFSMKYNTSAEALTDLTDKVTRGEITEQQGRELYKQAADAGFSGDAPKVAGPSRGHSIKLDAPVVINIHAGEGDDATHTGQKVGQEVRRHTVNALEAGVAQAGAGR